MQLICASAPPHNSTTVVGKMVRHSTKVLTARYEVILSKVSKSVIMEQGGKLVLMEHGGQARSSIILSMTVYGQLKGISN